MTVNGANVTGVNFTASAVPPTTYSISGTISPATNGSGATVTLSGASGATTTANSSGNYSFTGLANGSYTVTARKNGFSFSPASVPVTVSGANVTGMNLSAYSGPSVTITPGSAIQPLVDANPAGTTFVFEPGLYRLSSTIRPEERGQLRRPNNLRAARNLLSSHLEWFEGDWEFGCIRRNELQSDRTNPARGSTIYN